MKTSYYNYFYWFDLGEYLSGWCDILSCVEHSQFDDGIPF
jgi:hypothetical protein